MHTEYFYNGALQNKVLLIQEWTKIRINANTFQLIN